MNYDDIINLPHPTSKRHKPMSLQMRAAQFAPFAALTGHDAAIDETARLTEGQVELDGDVMKSLDQKMAELRDIMQQDVTQPTLTITYFQPDRYKAGGSYITQTLRLKSIDETQHRMIFSDGTTIPLAHIVDMEL